MQYNPNINVHMKKWHEGICQNICNDFLWLTEFQVIFVLFFILIFLVLQNFSSECIICIVEYVILIRNFFFNKIENVAPNDDCHSLVLWISDMNLIRSHLETMLGLDFTDCYFQIGEACRIFNQGRCHWIFACMVSARRSISKTYQNFKVE